MRWALAIALLVLAAGCNVPFSLDAIGDLDEVVGSGTSVTEIRDVDGFDVVRLEGVGEVDVGIGDAFSVEVTADDNLIDRLTTEVVAGTLVVGVEDGFAIVPRGPLVVRIELPDLVGLELSGAGDIDAGPIESDEVAVEVSGAGSIAIESVTAGDLTVSLSGVGSVRIDGGEVSTQTVTVSGVGGYEGGDLASGSADVSNSGVGRAEVWVTDALVAEVSGTGDIRYWGSPSVDASVSGLGSIDPLGDR